MNQPEIPNANPYQTSVSDFPPMSPVASAATFTPTEKTLRRIDPLSSGKVLGVLYALLGLIIAAIGLIMALLGGGGGPTEGLLLIIGAPILYGIAGLIGGVLVAVFYNLCASLVGGVQITLE